MATKSELIALKEKVDKEIKELDQQEFCTLLNNLKYTLLAKSDAESLKNFGKNCIFLGEKFGSKKAEQQALSLGISAVEETEKQMLEDYIEFLDLLTIVKDDNPAIFENIRLLKQQLAKLKGEFEGTLLKEIETTKDFPTDIVKTYGTPGKGKPLHVIPKPKMIRGNK